MNEPIITISGNLTGDPNLAYVSSGIPRATFTVASTPRKRNSKTGEYEDGQPMFVRCTAWRALAENVAETLSKGSGVIVTGRLTVDRWQSDTGEAREGMNLAVDDIGPSLKHAIAQVTRQTSRQNNNHGGYTAGAPDPAGNLANLDDLPPF